MKRKRWNEDPDIGTPKKRQATIEEIEKSSKVGYSLPFPISGSTDWNAMMQSMRSPLRLSGYRGEIHWKTSGSTEMKKQGFILESKGDDRLAQSQKLNYFFKRDQKPRTPVYDSPKKGQFDLSEIKESKIQLYAKNILRTMKGTAFTKGLEKGGHQKQALSAGGLVMLSERVRDEKAVYDAAHNLYKLKHRDKLAKPTGIKEVFNTKTGLFIPSHSGGADEIRKMKTGDILKGFEDAPMREIFEKHVVPKYGKKGVDLSMDKEANFKKWAQYKIDKWTKRLKY